MTSQPGSQTIAIDILTNISRSKSDQTMKLGQLVDYGKKTFFLKSYAENEAGRPVLDLFSLFRFA